MSAKGQKLTYSTRSKSSALPSIADEQADIAHRQLRANNDQSASQQKPAYSITSSARESSVGGIVRPSVLAVWRLMTSSNFVGCSTGRSAGLSPFRILST